MDPIVGIPQIPGWYWVLPQGSQEAVAVRVEWNSPDGTATFIQQLHCLDYVPTANGSDVWFGPLDPPQPYHGLQANPTV